MTVMMSLHVSVVKAPYIIRHILLMQVYITIKPETIATWTKSAVFKARIFWKVPKHSALIDLFPCFIPDH